MSSIKICYSEFRAYLQRKGGERPWVVRKDLANRLVERPKGLADLEEATLGAAGLIAAVGSKVNNYPKRPG
jgi:hypothetical protein